MYLGYRNLGVACCLLFWLLVVGKLVIIFILGYWNLIIGHYLFVWLLVVGKLVIIFILGYWNLVIDYYFLSICWMAFSDNVFNIVFEVPLIIS